MTARTAFLALVLTLPVMGTGCKNEQELSPEEAAAKLQSDLEEAAARVRNAKYEDAEKIYLRILEKDPKQPEALAGMAKVRMGESDYESAAVLLQKSLEIRPEHAATQFALGEVYRLTDQHAKAVKPYAKAFKLEPENSSYGLAHGTALKDSGRYEEAEKVLREVAELDPNVRFVWTELGDALREQGKLDEALKIYMKAQNTYRSDKMARAGAAMVYEAKGESKEALDQWSGYVRMDCCSEYSNNVAKKKIKELQEQAAQPAAEGEPAEARGDESGPAAEAG